MFTMEGIARGTGPYCGRSGAVLWTFRIVEQTHHQRRSPMKRTVILLAVAAVFLFAGFSISMAGDIKAPSARGPQWDKWNPRNNEDMGSPKFRTIASNTMVLHYGFRGALVYEPNGNRAERVRMATITRKKVEGYVNQVNDRLALAAGLYEIAVYDFSKHKWFVLEKVTPDDSTGALRQNFILTPTYAMVKQLGGPFYRYTTATGWQKMGR